MVFQPPSGKWHAHNTTGVVFPLNNAFASSTVRAVCSAQLDPSNALRSLLRPSSLPLTARTSLLRASSVGELVNGKVFFLFPD
jgi:hypothetical protein